MWLPFFAIVIAIALGFAVGALALESHEEGTSRQRKAVRSMRNA